MKVTMLGCGASAGVPMIGCDCEVCTSNDPKNKRSRVSLLLEINDINILIDTSPDLRMQAIANNIRRVDAVLYTHDHADHTHGVDDLRAFNYLSNKTIPVYGDQETIGILQEKFKYVFLPRPQNIWYRPSIEPHVLPDAPVLQFTLMGLDFVAFKQQHGKIATLGYRIGNFAYSTDVNHLPEAAFDALQGVEVWVVDCLRYTESPTHSNLERTLEWIGRMRPKLSVLTHMGHEFEYHKLASELPAGVVPGYDNMVIEL
jgi:phosphoribosyl 1,2-cyclic phosphate phosphodiesterase